MSGVFVVDASALVAALRGEPGAARVRELVPRSAMSTINLGEALQAGVRTGRELRGITDTLESLGLTIVPLDALVAERAAALWQFTRDSGLSLADRCCLALAERLGGTALTADRAWLCSDHGIPVELIR